MNPSDDDIDAMVRDLDASPPPGFADRVMDARARALPRRARFLGFAGSALAGAAACLAVVVAMPEPALRVALATPAGTLEGVRFTADINPFPETEMTTAIKPFPKTLTAAAVGAIAGAALTVAVSAGELTLSNGAGTITVKPGEVATVVEGAMPTKERGVTAQERELQLRTENEGLRAALEATRAASTGDVTKLVAENQALRERLKKTDEEVALLDDLRKSQEGEPRGFPADLAPRFAEASLQKAFDDALNEAGIEGGVIEVDCKEYPCLVYGQLSSKHDMDKLREASAFDPYQEDSDNTSLWHTNKVKDGKKTELAYFGVAFAPKEGKEGDDALNKRIGWRMQQMSETLFPKDQ